MDTKIRTFLAIQVPENISKEISELQKFLKPSNADANWIEPESFHYNLKFFGYLDEKTISKIEKTTENVSSSASPFEIEVQGIGGFPSLEVPRTIWIGASKGSNELNTLFKNLENAYSEIGVQKEEREFKAHLTLCRIKSNQNKKKLVEKAKQKQNLSLGEFTAEEIVLFRSVLKHSGPVYEKIKKFRLGG